MRFELKIAANYRHHAKELRTFAEADAATRGTLLKIAQDYEDAARLMENLGIGTPDNRRHGQR